MTVPSGDLSVGSMVTASWQPGVEGLVHRVDGRHPSDSRSARELALDGIDALHPGRRLLVGGHVLQGTREVVRDAEHLAQQRLAGERLPRVLLLLGAPPVVGEVGRGAQLTGLERLEVGADRLDLRLGDLGARLELARSAP